jgi:hypothetical protein
MAMREISPVTTVTVKVAVPIDLFKQLNTSTRDGLDVGQMLVEIAKKAFAKPEKRPSRYAPRSYYSSEVGVRMLRLREMNRSITEVASAFGLSAKTTGVWLRRAEAECRERALRDAA